VLCLAARLRDAALAEQSISALLDDLTSRSLLVLHPHSEWKEGFVFQIDGNFGAVAGLIELLVQSHEGAISLLKTLPPGWTAGSISAIRCRGGHQASVAWRDGRLEEAVIVAGQTAPLALDLPEGRYAVAGVNLEQVPGAAAGRVRVMWEAEAGVAYRVVAA
jgi:alpha-L-fucosidase 2